MEIADSLELIKNAWSSVDKLTLIVAVLACFVAWRTWRTQASHNRLSIVPLPVIGFGTGADHVGIKLSNQGIGPMRILSLRFVRDDGVIFDAVRQTLTTKLGHVKTVLDGKWLGANREMKILELKVTPRDGENVIETTKGELSRYSMVLQYTDVYGTKFPTLTESMIWFERHG